MTAVYDKAERFTGHRENAVCDHSTVGKRAWCSTCSEWCYPDEEMACLRCEHEIRQLAEALTMEEWLP